MHVNHKYHITCGFGLFVCETVWIVVGNVLDVVADDVDDVDDVDVDRIGRLFTCKVVALDDEIGFFDGFGLAGRDGNFSHCCVGFGFVIKFGCVVTCHCVVCEFGFHKPERNVWTLVQTWEQQTKKKTENSLLPVDMLDAESKSGTVFSVKFGEV